MTVTARNPLWLTEYADPRKLKEKQIEAMCINLYRSLGVWVVKFSQPHKASQTRGVPDLLCYYRRRPYVECSIENNGEVVKFWHEVKRYGAKVTPAQEAFHGKLTHYGEDIVVGGLNSAIDWLRYMQIARFEPREGHW